MKLHVSNDGDCYFSGFGIKVFSISTPYFPNSSWFRGSFEMRVKGRTILDMGGYSKYR